MSAVCLCFSVRQFHFVLYDYVCVRVDVWEAVILCTGVGVKADRMRIVIIIMPRI